MLSVACYLGAAWYWLPLQCGSPPLLLFQTLEQQRKGESEGHRGLTGGCHAVAEGGSETGRTLTLCLCSGRPCDRCCCQCIHPLRCGAVHLPWRRWIGLCFPPHLHYVINLQLESMEESALRLWADTLAGGQLSRPRGQAPPEELAEEDV